MLLSQFQKMIIKNILNYFKKYKLMKLIQQLILLMKSKKQIHYEDLKKILDKEKDDTQSNCK